MNIIDKIMKLDNAETFWQDVRKIVGFYDERILQDWLIKKIQRWADYRYEQLLERNSEK